MLNYHYFLDLNPGYKVFYADGVRPNATWQITDHETYVYDLAAANEAGSSVMPSFYKEYSAKEAYAMDGFRPTDLWDFVQRMAVDDDLFRTYFKYVLFVENILKIFWNWLPNFYRFYPRHWYKDSGKDAVDGDCPSGEDVSECKFEFLCEIVNTDYTNKHCDILRGLAANAKQYF